MILRHYSQRIKLGIALLTPLGALAGPVPANRPASYPKWWFERDVILRSPEYAEKSDPEWPTHYPPADDFAIANIGQLKNFATAATHELQGRINVSTLTLNKLIFASSPTGWQHQPAPEGVVRDDYAALNQGQLKAVAEIFYNRLNQFGYKSPLISPPARIYPWSGDGADDYAVVNIGQLKQVFALFLVSDPADRDEDGLPDAWENAYGGLSMRPWEDSDLDGSTNLEEYQANTDPAYANPGSLGTACISAVDDRLTGADPTTALNLYITRNHTAGTYVRNPGAWCANLDLTSISPYNSINGDRYSGTLITPRHILLATHTGDFRNGTMRFVTTENSMKEYTVIDQLSLPNTDLTVGLLDSDVSTEISPAKILPSNYRQYFAPQIILAMTHIPGLCLDQQERASVMDLLGLYPTASTFIKPNSSIRTPFHRDIASDGDSGNPAFLIIDNELVLITVWTQGGSGSPAADFAAEIQQAISTLDSAHGISPPPESPNKYNLVTKDLSTFVPY